MAAFFVAGACGTTTRNLPSPAGVLKAVFDVAIVGDDAPVPMLERDVVKKNIAEPDPRKKLRLYAQIYIQRAARFVPVQLRARQAAASDPAAAEV